MTPKSVETSSVRTETLPANCGIRFEHGRTEREMLCRSLICDLGLSDNRRRLRRVKRRAGLKEPNKPDTGDAPQRACIRSTRGAKI
jgi:hypothetical protein